MFETSQASGPAASPISRADAPVSKPVSAPLTPSQIAIVKSTAPLLKEHGEEIATLFYGNMLKAHPELHNIFNQTGQLTGAQPRALAGAVFAYASYVDDLGRLQALVERIAHKHVSLTVQADQYAIVGKHLIDAVATVLGDAVTPDVADAWTAAYAALADIFIDREKELYTAHERWTGWRPFKIQKKVVESAEITSFYLVPEDGKALPLFKPGQYISLHLFIPQLGYMQPRQYSLSDAPRSDYYRISVKKESGKVTSLPGLVSNLLHENYKESDVVELTHPTGDFLDDSDPSETAPLVLISAGVGITPMISILNNAVSAGSQRPVSWIHGTHSSELQAFGSHVQTIGAEHPNVQATIFRSTVAAAKSKGVDYHFDGRVDLNKVDQARCLFLDNTAAEYYICGPTAFMQSMQRFLIDAAVDQGRIHMEVFGVGDGK
ncbi:putative Flavohemo protein [Seiridium cardinale]|uniref:nitric oxide dioxygenase n=1 Tax=Seiridium cardinale TaxID=138064 RepID=A0ABR2XX47_9PEZI